MKYRPGKISQRTTKVGYTNGGQFMDYKGVEYVGQYFILGTKVIPGTPDTYKITDNLPTLIPYNSDDEYVKYIGILKATPYINNRAPIPYVPSPTKKEYEAGFIYRYFCRKRNDNRSEIIEIDNKQYKAMSVTKGINIDLYHAIRVKWQIVGRREDVMHGDMVAVPSLMHANQKAVKDADILFPGLIVKLHNLAEFAFITE